MKTDDLKALPPKLAGDFRSIEPSLAALDKHLTLRSYLDGYTLSDVDSKIWVALAENRAAVSFVRRGTLVNLKRWFLFVEDRHPEIQDSVKAASAALKAKVAAASRAGGSYNMSLKDADKGVVTRFLPEPSGYLHIGHAKAALLSDYFARQYKGTLKLRLDDTNPSKEKEEFQDAIIEDLRLMGIRPDTLSYTSDYFDYLYAMALRLIQEGHAYADDTDQDTMRDQRMNGVASQHRDRPVAETLQIFTEEMKNATAVGAKHCIRAKISVDDNNKTLRDPVIYRVNVETAHHRTGTTWKMYPTYDFACPVIDSHEGITHAMRSTEYTDRNAQYQWFLTTLQLRQVHMFDFARMNFIRTFLSKRKLAKLVDTGRVWGWDDPRMPTIRGVRRRGMTIPALRDFILKQGPSRSVTTMEWGVFWAANKKEIDPVAPRHTVVSAKDAVKVTVTGADAPAAPQSVEKPLHPKNKDVGTKQVVFSSEILLDQADVKLMKVGEEITLMSWGNAIVKDIQAGADGVVTAATVELHLAGDVKKTEKKVTWLSTAGQTLLKGEAWDFDYLLTKNTLTEDDVLEDCLNPVTATEEDVLGGANMKDLKKDDIIQLERRGFYRVDKGLGDWAEGQAGEKGARIVMFLIPSGKST
ncbi:glutamyl-tRNA synthetase [Sporothrix brasiliensis 5110]|uniref:glutamate--tRNA ligase n=1 Tax=Sporothrix brasiliensis 5110 TaxID=1398154 RepID=A0A0C2FP52_9PEZI|nr:glutamyl-tRNA synthetase [Sporothrix brasiliensis 5110]KIH92833.1 glutamyl-tRNA synthetase [Sporothrix brasiliensis 5110]